MNKIIMRTKASIDGLNKMIDYIAEYKDLKEMTIVEIGAFAGDATKVFCERFGLVYAVDPWNKENMNVKRADPVKVYKEYLENTKEFTNIKTIINTSVKAYNNLIITINTLIDIIYIDAIHDYEHVLQDVKTWKPILRQGGFICGHDYSNKFPGVKRAVNELFGNNFKLFPDTSWLVRI